MYITGQFIDPALKPCPFCNWTVINVSTVGYPNGDDDGYKIICQCGWAARLLRKWSPNKARLVEEWNSYIIDADVV